MPIKIKDGLPAIKILEKENIFVITETHAIHQDIRPLRLAILNLMPEKPKTELHLLRRLSNTPIQIEVELFHPETHECKNTPLSHLKEFYTTFNSIKFKKFDGLIITGAPVEQLEFEQVDYWEELKRIMEWSKHNVFSTLHLCWAAQAGLYYHHRIRKHQIGLKKFGIFEHNINNKKCLLVRGFDDIFLAPHSRHTTVLKDEIIKNHELEIISESDDAGVYIVISRDNKQIFVTGHSEYDPLTLDEEYKRDVSKGLKIDLPVNYYPNNDPKKYPIVKWRSHSSLLFTNWINYYVYQATPFNIEEII
jgi:homoserine O-succinyltransferase/O-acetyltransferase